MDIDNWTMEELESVVAEFRQNQETLQTFQVLADTNSARQYDSFRGELIHKIEVRWVNQGSRQNTVSHLPKNKVRFPPGRVWGRSYPQISRHCVAARTTPGRLFRTQNAANSGEQH